jgi:hypothetical protein
MDEFLEKGRQGSAGHRQGRLTGAPVEMALTATAARNSSPSVPSQRELEGANVVFVGGLLLRLTRTLQQPDEVGDAERLTPARRIDAGRK